MPHSRATLRFIATGFFSRYSLCQPHEDDEDDTRYHFYRDLVCVLELRPLIESGIVLLLPSFLNYCPHCMPIAVPERPDICNAARELTAAHLKDFKMFYERDGKRGYPITLKGPQTYYFLRPIPESLGQRPVCTRISLQQTNG
ncbi:MAG: hypothetical protein DMG77_03180 [Acidobacteria bacterium]|nr:MAG: hypothetical protein DMG77_03180 [Acidobacteriota bacterium]